MASDRRALNRNDGRRLPVPETGRAAAERFVEAEMGHLIDRRGSGGSSSLTIRGGQSAADRALADLNLDGYHRARNEAYPQHRRRASQLSPWIRHGLLTLPRVWDHASAMSADVEDLEAFRHALQWQEYARHRYAARTSSGTSSGQGDGGGSTGDRRRREPAPDERREAPDGSRPANNEADGVWDRRLGCLQITLDELEEDGWLVDQGRRWLASHWTNRHGRRWQDGERYFFTHLIDGSRAVNRLAWQLAAEQAPSIDHRFSRWEVEARAAGLCASCELVRSCPIERPLEPPALAIDASDPTDAGRRRGGSTPADSDRGAGSGGSARVELGLDDLDWGGPVAAEIDRQAEAVWLTAESMGDGDPALAAHPDLPAVFVFDEPLLAELRLSPKRLVFLTETLAELATRRPVEVWLGDPTVVLAGRALAVTFTPVPGWRRRAKNLTAVARHPWPWLYRPSLDGWGAFQDWRTVVEARREAATQTSTGCNEGSLR